MQLRSQTREKALNFSCEGGDGRTSSIGGTQACDGNIYLKVDLVKQQKCFFFSHLLWLGPANTNNNNKNSTEVLTFYWKLIVCMFFFAKTDKLGLTNSVAT